MTTNEKWELGVGGAIVIILLLLAYSSGAAQEPPLPPDEGLPPLPPESFFEIPPYWQPAISIPTPTLPNDDNNFTIVNTPGSKYNVGNGVSCSCGCNNQASFSSVDAMVNSYAAALNNENSSLFNNTIGALPSYISQFVNNLTGFGNAALLAEGIGAIG